ncbi:hypothetical protein PAXINDRAFT_15247 [Paxillus involutus ATCC 200175]|uniref:RNA polymerase Rpb1 domain-containing protein n=1 Tax=Paxillus involutus ATCC 200175 TaxID=664439 RepID=A0A0C9TX26_PAXIN|nr:hypothetical protein PAXINDRAFT_15247 [Paxillus involutus ATCC 200175]
MGTARHFDVNGSAQNYSYGSVTRPLVARGWVEFSLPHRLQYYEIRDSHTITDIDLRNLARLDEVSVIIETGSSVWSSISEDNSEKLIIQRRALGGGGNEDDGMRSVKAGIFLRPLENMMLNSVSLRGVPGIRRVFLQGHDKVHVNEEGSIKSKIRWMLETDGINFKTVMCMERAPYDTNFPAWSETAFKGESVAFSPLAVQGREDATSFSFLGYVQSLLGAGAMSPAGPGYSPSSLNAYSPTSPRVPQLPFGGATPPFGTSPYAIQHCHFMIGVED